MNVLVGAYAASPAFRDWDPVLERELYDAIFALPGVAGFELPWLGRIHPHDDEWLLTSLPTGAELSITGVPHVAKCGHTDPHYGLASPDTDGRRRALADMARLRDDAARLADAGRAQVRVVELHTAPCGGGSIDALAPSLDELAAADWGGAELVIEHCDAALPRQAFEKGFMALADELAAIRASGAPVGVWINWGRSAIELRDPDAVAGQIADAASSGLLRAVAFSGAADRASEYGPAWADTHLPIAVGDLTVEGSLLTPQRVADALTAAGPVPWLGLKVSRRPQATTVEDVVADLRAQLDTIRSAALAATSS